VEEFAPFEISILGEVARPGMYRVEGDATVLNALALAGGVTQLADRDRIFVLRYDDPQAPTRIRFTYRALTQAEANAARFRLRQRDVLVVE
jgi:polysaccharide export outer membrane protein